MINRAIKNTKYIFYFGFQGIIIWIKLLLKQGQTTSFTTSKYLHPIFIRNNTSDLPTFDQIFIKKEYEQKLNFVPSVIFDCGANVGYAAVYFKNKFPNAKIISIEPEQSNFELLIKNTNKYSDITCLKGGIWNKSANLIIKDAGFGNWGFMIEETDKPTENAIEAYSIENLMKRFNIDQIDILKIDIEGSEKELFESGYEYWLPKTKVIIVELHDRMRDGCSKSFFKALSNYNFSTSHKGENLYVYMK